MRIAVGRLIVPVTTSGGRPASVRDRLVAWYRERASVLVPERVASWSGKLGLHPSSVFIREPRKRWGSADAKGHVRFDWRILQAPTKLFGYVITRELVHLVP